MCTAKGSKGVREGVAVWAQTPILVVDLDLVARTKPGTPKLTAIVLRSTLTAKQRYLGADALREPVRMRAFGSS